MCVCVLEGVWLPTSERESEGGRGGGRGREKERKDDFRSSEQAKPSNFKENSANTKQNRVEKDQRGCGVFSRCVRGTSNTHTHVHRSTIFWSLV